MVIEIASYNPDWPAAFAAEAERLRFAIAQPALVIEHIGSTAVPGLAAKPVIDIMPGVESALELDACVKPLVAIGYTYIPDYEDVMPFRRFLRKALTPDQRPGFNLHIVARGSKFWHEHLGFRDRLRHDQELAQRYEALKRELASQHTDTNEYAGAKTEFIVSALAAATGTGR